MKTSKTDPLSYIYNSFKNLVLGEPKSTQQSRPIETQKTKAMAQQFFVEKFIPGLTQIFFTNNIDLRDPSSLKQLMMISKDDRLVFLDNLKNQIPMVREAVRTNPGLLRAPGLPTLFLNDYTTISQALQKTPLSYCL